MGKLGGRLFVGNSVADGQPRPSTQALDRAHIYEFRWAQTLYEWRQVVLQVMVPEKSGRPLDVHRQMQRKRPVRQGSDLGNHAVQVCLQAYLVRMVPTIP